MLSDGRLVDRPLKKADCGHCSLLSHLELPTDKEVLSFFDEGYSLYAHAPGRPEERARQGAYASWILESIGPLRPRRLLEIGCGNGSLLLELGRLLPGLETSGLDPSGEAVAHARAAGIAARTGRANDAGRLEGQDVVLSVNVIEHTSDPVDFLRALGSAVTPGGRIVVVCPDGISPTSELLIFDHLFSFSTTSFARLASRADLRVETSRPAPTTLGAFRLFVLAKEQGRSGESAHEAAALHACRRKYLEAWAGLDGALADRTEGSRVVCFGVGETALLLRAYAPLTFARVEGFIVDHPFDSTFCGRPLAKCDRALSEPDTRLLLAVRPRDQAAVFARMKARFDRVVRWDDIVSS